jgi:hypothetical protein
MTLRFNPLATPGWNCSAAVLGPGSDVAPSGLQMLDGQNQAEMLGPTL